VWRDRKYVTVIVKRSTKRSAVVAVMSDNSNCWSLRMTALYREHLPVD